MRAYVFQVTDDTMSDGPVIHNLDVSASSEEEAWILANEEIEKHIYGNAHSISLTLINDEDDFEEPPDRD